MENTLKKYFGYDSFKPLQKEIIEHVLQKKDTFVLMPTGGGKSLCYQLPALMFEGTTLVISPLIALMKDQVDSLRVNGVNAAFINSSISFEEQQEIKRNVLSGDIKLLYIAPERFAIDSFKEFLSTLTISLIAIDEAHCISEWGHDFRPDYRNLKQLKEVFPGTPIIALTATATERVRKDIHKQLEFSAKEFVSSFNRENLVFKVVPKKDAFEKLVSLLEKNKGESAIVYCFSRKDTEKLTENLRMNGFSARAYHAGLSDEKRIKHQELFIKDEVDIIVATIAFGMGIDKPDVRLVVHYSFPKTLEGYYQEVGRAGRDGLQSECVMFYSYGDKMKHDYFIRDIQDEEERRNIEQKIQKVIRYAEAPGCRREHLLRYFGEQFKPSREGCGACDMCLSPKELLEAKEIAGKILSCVYKTGGRFGKKYIADILKGSRQKKIIENGHDTLSVHGIVKNFSANDIKHIMGALIHEGLIKEDSGQYPTISLEAKGVAWLKSGDGLSIRKTWETEKEEPRRKIGSIEYNEDLFTELRALRKELAQEKGVPPFMIFSDKSLHEMAHYIPKTVDAFLQIQGVGEQKCEAFSESFLKVIVKFSEEHSIDSIEKTKTSSKKIKKKIKKGVGSIKKERHEKTRELLSEGMDIAAIASDLRFTESTILGYIEEMIQNKQDVPLSHVKPEDAMLKEIAQAFDESEDGRLKPVRDSLDQKYSYEDIRLVRLFL